MGVTVDQLRQAWRQARTAGSEVDVVVRCGPLILFVDFDPDSGDCVLETLLPVAKLRDGSEAWEINAQIDADGLSEVGLMRDGVVTPFRVTD